MTAYKKLRNYINAYIPDSHLIDGGFCKWEVYCPTKEGRAKIARKAILLGMKIEFEQEIMYVKY